MQIKCHKCKKDVEFFSESKKATDLNRYCLNCFKEENLKEYLTAFSLTSILLKFSSLIFLCLSLSRSIYYDSTEVILNLTLALILWALSVIVKKVCVIERYIREKNE